MTARATIRCSMAALLLIVLVSAAVAQTRKPKAAPGRDPGGIAVAVVGNGVNYLRPEIAARLARDGEGEAIAFDLGDNDNRPIEREPPPSATSPMVAHTALAHLVLREAGASRLVIARRKPGDRDGLARAAAFAAQTPARIILVLHDGTLIENWALLRQAAQHFRKHLLIVPVAARLTIDPAAAVPADFRADNVLIVTAVASEQMPPVSTWPVVGADIATVSRLDLRTDTVTPAGPETAAARVAALAARLLAVEPQLEGAALKARISALAKTPEKAGDPPLIAEPHRPFRLE